jgi:restriction endonuclease S subunit
MSSSAKKTYLGDYVDFQNGYAFKSSEYTDKGHYLIRIKNVQQGFIEINDDCFVNIPSDAKFEKFKLKNGDIVVSLTGNVGRIARIKDVHLPAVLNQRVASVAPKSEKVLSPEYLYYLLRTPEFLEFAIDSGKGAAQQNISTSDMETYQVSIPSLEKQTEIVKRLDSAFAEIDSFGESITNRIKNASELFAEICLMKTNDLNPTGFKSLKEIASVITKGTTPTSLGYRFTSSGINFLKVESLDENGGFIENKFAFIDSVCHESLKRSQLMENDVLVSIAGALGRTAIVTADVCPANVNQALSLIRLPKDSEISPKFLIALFQSGYFRTDLDRMGAGAAQQNLSLAQIGSLKVPIFPESKQKEFIDFLYNLSGLITDLKAQLEYQYLLKSELQKSILAKTFLHSTDSELVA